MGKTIDIQSGGIVFGDWKLFPVDDRNWELCQYRTALDRHGNPAGDEFRWYCCGRFYQYNTLHLALQYAADRELKDSAYLEPLYCGFHRMDVKPDNYCSWGKRRADS